MQGRNTQWALATPEHKDLLVELMQAFYVEEQLDFCPSRASVSAEELLSTTQYGAVLLLQYENTLAGYVIATFGYSLEFGGRFVLVDELYIKPEARGMGEGKRALVEVEKWANAQGVKVLRIEVNDHNKKALAIYTGAGFAHINRYILSK